MAKKKENKAKSGRRTITAKDIQRYHPAMLGPCPTDIDYAKVANEIWRMIEADGIFSHEPLDTRELSIKLTMYFEDVVSEGGTWQAFVYMCRQLWKRDIPFFPEMDMDKDNPLYMEYYDDEVNLDDIRLIMWMELQRKRTISIVNPETAPIYMLAGAVFLYLMEKFEKMPINAHLTMPLLIVPNDEYQSLLHLRELMQWILRDNYLFADPKYDEDLVTFENNYKALAHVDEVTDLVRYGAESNIVFAQPTGPLSLLPCQWLGAMIASVTDDLEYAKTVANIEYRTLDVYNLLAFDEQYLEVVDAYGVKLKIERTSLEGSPDFSKIKSIITSLVKVGGRQWYVNGNTLLTENRIDLDEWRRNLQINKYGFAEDGEKELMSLERYKGYLGGKRYGFFKSMKAFNKALIPQGTDLDAVGEEYQNVLKNLDDKDPVFVFVYSSGQAAISTSLATAIPDKENPYYEKGKDADLTMAGEVINVEYGDAELVEFLISKGWFKNVSLKNVKGVRYGKKQFKENVGFLSRFLRRDPYYAKITKVI